MTALYEIRLEGHLDPCWSEWLEDMTITPLEDGSTLISGAICDSSCLYGLLNLLRDMNLVLISVERKNKNQ